MKHNEQLLRAMSDIDQDIIVAAMPKMRPKQPAAWKKWMPTAACFVLAAVIGVAAWQMHAPELKHTEDEQGQTETVWNTEATFPATATELGIAVAPRWEEQGNSARFGEFEVGEIRYNTRDVELEAAQVGEQLGSAIARGYDIYTDTLHEIGLDYFAIRGISTECALAARFEGDEGYYVYVNTWYRPETLDDFITDLNLRENMTFGDFHASYHDENRRLEQVTIHDPDDSIVWELLLSDTSLENVWEDTGWYISVMSISVNIPILGRNSSIWITEDGYLCTNILNSGKAFYIGEEQVGKFLQYVVLNCPDRTVVVYDYSQEEGAQTAAEDNGEESDIVVMTSQGYFGDQEPQTATAQTSAAEPYIPGTVTSPAYNITTSEE